MRKKKTSKKRDFCLKDYPAIRLKKGIKTKKFSPSEKLNDFNLVATAFFEALQEDDVESALDILEGYIMTKKKHDTHSFSKSANPTLKTVAKILHAAS